MELKVLYTLVLTGCLFAVCHGRARYAAMDGDYSIMYTPDNNTYENFVLEVLESDVIVFKVKACSDAHILLVDEISNKSHHAIEIVIGGWENSWSVIRDGLQGNVIGETVTYPILHCGEYRQFWIHWSQTHFSVGKGPTYLEQPFVTAERTGSRNHPINFVAFSTGFGHTGTWELQENVGYHLMAHTPDTTPEQFEYVTKRVERKEGVYFFRARACHDLHIAMGPTPGLWDFKINLCGSQNTKHCIRAYGQWLCYSNKTEVCDCNKEKMFWVSWVANHIKAGEGKDYKEQILIDYTQTDDVVVDYLSFATGWGSTGEYIFDESTGDAWDVKSASGRIENRNYAIWLVTAKRHFIPLQVMACKEAYIAITDQPAMDTELDAYHIVIGAYDNQKTVIREDFAVGDLYSVDTPNVLDCNQTKPFWLSTQNGKVELGHGMAYGHFKFLEWQIPRDDFEVQSVGLSMHAGAEGFWNIKKNHADGAAYFTPPEYRVFEHFWMSVHNDYIMYFRVKGKKDAYILLSQIVGFNVGMHTEVLIGYNNQYTNIQRTNKEGQTFVLASSQTPEVLSATEFREFYISWLDNKIRVGAGHRYGYRVLVEETLAEHPINGMAFSSWDASLEWEFESNSGDHVFMRTPTSNLHYKWFHMYDVYDGGYWFYFQVSGAEASLMISANYRDATTNAYRFGLGEEFNTRVSLYRGSKRVAEKQQADILHLDEMRTFWVSWMNGRIKLGTGPYRDSNTLIDYGDGDFNSVTGVAVAGTDDHVAYWRLYEHQGIEEYTFDTNKYPDAEQVWMSVNSRSHMLFSVKACQEVNVWMSALMHSTDAKDNYLLTIQDADGYTSISAPFMAENREAELKKRVWVNSPDILSCNEERVFWISFSGDNTVGTIVLGHGFDHGVNPIISYHSFDSVPVKAISFTTKDTTGIFRVPITSRAFATIKDPPSTAMSAGEIVAAVFGFIALFALFAVAVIVIIRPPKSLEKYLGPTQGQSGDTGMSNVQRGFDNPLQGQVDSVEEGYNQ